MADTKDSGLDAAEPLADADIVAVTQDVAGILASRRTTIGAIKAYLAAMANPMTTVGDLIIGGLAGAASRLAAGSNGQVLKMVGGSPAWAAESGGGGASEAPVATESGTALAATDANSGNYTRFTNVAAKTYTFDSAQSYTVGDEYHGRNVGAGALTLTAAGTFALNAPVGGTLVVAAGGVFTVKIVAAGEADVFGTTVAS